MRGDSGGGICGVRLRGAGGGGDRGLRGAGGRGDHGGSLRCANCGDIG